MQKSDIKRETCIYITNYYFCRKQLTQLISNLNEQKDRIKKNGIVVDGKKYQIAFTGSLYTSQ